MSPSIAFSALLEFGDVWMMRKMLLNLRPTEPKVFHRLVNLDAAVARVNAASGADEVEADYRPALELAA